MNWISENKFLAGFFAFMFVALGVLGFLLFQAVGGYNAVHESYVGKLQTLNSLQSLVPYPNDRNLKNYKEQKTSLAGIIGNLEQNLSTVQFPLDPSETPAGFQDKLRASVNDVLAKAKANNVRIPEKFALGFDRYLTEPPSKEAAPALARELKAVEFVINELLDSGVESIGSQTLSPINRTPLPEETKAKISPALVSKSFLDISFVVRQGKFRKILNDLVETKKQFYIVRMLQIKNQGEKGVSIKVASTSSRDKNGNLRLVVGDEKLEVSLKLEIVNFNPPQK